MSSKMKKAALVLLCGSLYSMGSAQNLVPNGSFEQFTSCPNGYNQIDFASNWFNPCVPPYGSIGTESGSSDYFNACDSFNFSVPNNIQGFQPARTGHGYAGLIPYFSISTFREYIEVQLTTPLIAGENYYFEMYVNVSNNSRYAIDALSAYFSDTIISGLHSHLPLPYNPQISNLNGIISDTTNWVLINGNFIASGGELFLLIGNFNDDLNTNWLQLTSNLLQRSYYYIDDVSLTLATSIEESGNATTASVFPSPFNNTLNVKVNSTKPCQIIVYDITGRIINQQLFSNEITLNTMQLTKGVYFYEVINDKCVIKNGKIIKE
jgi:hypothetical protein